MSKVLMIRHLPTALSHKDKEQLLKHFGAEQVWETKSKRNYIFASFPNVDIAVASLSRLHQLKIGQRRLVVEYSFEKEPLASNKQENQQSSLVSNHVKKFLGILNAWNPSVDFYQPPPTHLKYKYPEITTRIAINIVSCLFSHKPFYTQVLHLMNRMSLDSPFDEHIKSLECFKSMFKEYFIDELLQIPQPESDPESEISSDENSLCNQPLPKLIKRKHLLPVTRKCPATVLSTATLPKAKKSKISQGDIFETIIPVQEIKKISVVVPQDALCKQSQETEVVGELGKFQKEEKPTEDEPTQVEAEQPTVTKKELLRNRLSYRDMKVLPVFKNYHPGECSMRLYIKNLAKTVTEQDVKSIYRRFIENLIDEEQIGFDVRVMQEGRMKGQAFVTFPTARIAEIALNETNGYLLKDKPMVVQFARVANKKSID